VVESGYSLYMNWHWMASINPTNYLASFLKTSTFSRDRVVGCRYGLGKMESSHKR
jgi:hypothetical protein